MRLIFLPIACYILLILGFIFFFDAFVFIILPLIGLLFLLLSPLVNYLWQKIVPVEARLLTLASRKKLIPIYVVSDSGVGRIELVKDIFGEGVAKMLDGKHYRLFPQYPYPRETAQNPTSEKPLYMDYLTKRTILKHMKIPFFIAYSGRLCLLDPAALAAYEASLQNREGEKGKDQTLMLLDPRKIKDIIGDQFSINQVAAIMQESETIGALQSNRLFKFIMPISIILIAIVAIMIVLTFLK